MCTGVNSPAAPPLPRHGAPRQTAARTSPVARLGTRTLGAGPAALTVSTLGLGCLGMSEFYGTIDESEAVSTLHRALDLGVTLLDTADMYGPFTNERLVGGAIKGRRDEVVLATEFGNVRDPDNPTLRRIDGTPDYVRWACDQSLQRLGVGCCASSASG